MSTLTHMASKKRLKRLAPKATAFELATFLSAMNAVVVRGASQRSQVVWMTTKGLKMGYATFHRRVKLVTRLRKTRNTEPRTEVSGASLVSAPVDCDCRGD